MKNTFLLILILSCFSTYSAPKIILKLDDLSVQKGKCQFIPTMDYLSEKQIKAGFGVVANRLDNTASDVLKPYLKATNKKGEKLFEIWHHGWDHKSPEFKGTSYEYQKAHFEDADKLINKLIGVQMHSFGTPGNASDSITNIVVSENPNFKVFLFGRNTHHGSNELLFLTNRVNMENGTGNPVFDFFKSEYAKSKDKFTNYMILQGHPNGWTPEKLEQFKLIIDFLIAEGCEFGTPFGYYQSLNRPAEK